MFSYIIFPKEKLLNKEKMFSYNVYKYLLETKTWRNKRLFFPITIEPKLVGFVELWLESFFCFYLTNKQLFYLMRFSLSRFSAWKWFLSLFIVTSSQLSTYKTRNPFFLQSSSSSSSSSSSMVTRNSSRRMNEFFGTFNIFWGPTFSLSHRIIELAWATWRINEYWWKIN